MHPPPPAEPIGQPLWSQVAQRISSDIAAGRWVRGQQLPSRRQLALDHGVALKTVNRAVAALIADGVLLASSRVATYVAADLPKQPRASAPAPAQRLDRQRLLVLMPRPAATSPTDDPWTAAVLHHAEAAAGKIGAHLICVPVWPADAANFAATLKQELARHQPDAVALLNLYASDDQWTEDCAQQLDVLVTPCLLLSTTQAPATFPHLTYDQRHAGFYAARHLLSAGYERLVFLDLGAEPWLDERLSGAREAARGSLFAPRPRSYPALRALQGGDRTLARQALVDCLATAEAGGALRWDGRSGIIAPADEFALLVLDLLAERGRQAGAEVGVIGFDDLPEGRQRGLSTIRPPMSTYGHELVAVLTRALAQGPELYQRRLTPELVARASTIAAPTGHT